MTVVLAAIGFFAALMMGSAHIDADESQAVNIRVMAFIVACWCGAAYSWKWEIAKRRTARDDLCNPELNSGIQRWAKNGWTVLVFGFGWSLFFCISRLLVVAATP